MEKKLYSPKSLAEMLDVHQQTIYNWIHQGCPTEIKQSKFVRLDYEKVREWLEGREQKTSNSGKK